MASYYMDGYTPPQGVDSASKVKDMQRMLGVKVDGIWGPNTDAAYRASLSGQSGTWGDSGRDSVFNSYYNAIKNSLTVPTIDIKVPTKDEISDMWEEVLRPSTDAAIEQRNKTAQRDMAELDADAVSRGMGGSTYVTSMKSREMEDAQEDIDDIEAQYGAMLAERIYNTLTQYEQMSLSAKQYNASTAQNAVQTALAMASDWYSQYLSQQKSSSGGSSSKSSSSSSKSSVLSVEDYTEYVRNLTSAQQKLLFNSSSEYWSTRRNEIYSALGSVLFENLKKQYGGS